MMVILGFDAGNSEATLTWHQGTTVRHVTAPSFVGSGSLSELRRVRGAVGSERLQKDEFVLGFGGSSYYAGRLAMEESRDASAARNDVSRYWNGHALRLLLALAGAAGISGPARIMTGLPISAWTTENKRAVQRGLIGTHVYTFNGKDRTLTIDAVGVMMEGAAALASQSVTTAPYAIIDIGGRTIDLFWSEGVRPITQRCAAEEIGVEKVADLLRQHILERHRRELQPKELRGILRAYITGAPMPQVFASGKEVVYCDAVDAAVSAVGQQITSYVVQQWGDDRGVAAGEAARVLLIGGGAYFFADALRSVIPHIELVRPPELANAMGYLSVGSSATEEAWARNRG